MAPQRARRCVKQSAYTFRCALQQPCRPGIASLLTARGHTPGTEKLNSTRGMFSLANTMLFHE